MNIERIPIATIKRAKYNPRVLLKPADPEYKRLKKAIDTFGMVEPIIWNKRSGNLVGGHQRLSILEARGDTDVEVSTVDLSDREEKALNIALNKQGGTWDREQLGQLLKELNVDAFDMDLTGFGPEELMTFQPPKFGPADAEAQGRLDQQTPITCPKCGHEFTK
jgi:ParB-like chromosome segregation protein Spo0J